MLVTQSMAKWPVVLMLSLAAAACSSPGSSETSDEGADGSLIVGVEQIPKSLNPGRTFESTALAILSITQGTLVKQTPDGSDVTMELAESIESTDDRLVVKLKPDLKFSDGSALTATDVAASFEYYKTAKLNGASYTLDALDKVEAVDDLTINFDLGYRFQSLPLVLALPQSAIIPSEAIEADPKDPWASGALPSAGQFAVESLERNEMTLQVNPNYAGETPDTKTIVFKGIPDANARMAQLQSGQLDYANNLPPKQAAQLSDPIRVDTTENALGVTYFGMNNRDNSVLSDVRIRKALSMAIDRQQVNEVAFAGFNAPQLSIWSNESPYYAAVPYLSDTADVEAAQQMLVGTACEDGCTLKMVAYADFADLLDSATVVQQNLAAIGITVQIEKSDSSTVLEWKSEGNYDISVDQYYDYWPAAAANWGLGPAVMAVRTGYSSVEMNDLIEQADRKSGSARDAVFAEINALFAEDLPWAPIAGLVRVAGSRVPAETFSLDPTFLYHVD